MLLSSRDRLYRLYIFLTNRLMQIDMVYLWLLRLSLTIKLYNAMLIYHQNFHETRKSEMLLTYMFPNILDCHFFTAYVVVFVILSRRTDSQLPSVPRAKLDYLTIAQCSGSCSEGSCTVSACTIYFDQPPIQNSWDIISLCPIFDGDRLFSNSQIYYPILQPFFLLCRIIEFHWLTFCYSCKLEQHCKCY